eukprot:127204-Chlamydomonas_euryale.AAC.3
MRHGTQYAILIILGRGPQAALCLCVFVRCVWDEQHNINSNKLLSGVSMLWVQTALLRLAIQNVSIRALVRESSNCSGEGANRKKRPLQTRTLVASRLSPGSLRACAAVPENIIASSAASSAARAAAADGRRSIVPVVAGTRTGASPRTTCATTPTRRL